MPSVFFGRIGRSRAWQRSRGLRNEALVVRVAFDDLDVDAHVRAVLDDLLLEALVDQRLLHAAAQLGDLVQQGDARGRMLMP